MAIDIYRDPTAVDNSVIDEITVQGRRPEIEIIQDPEERSLADGANDRQMPSASDIAILQALGQSQSKGDFETNVAKYQKRLEPYSYQAPKMSFFDLASELGAGLLSTPNTGGASAYIGLGVGFANVSNTLKKTKEDNAKARQQLGLQAAQLAMQDEQKADEFLNQIALKAIDNANKKQDSITIEYEKDIDGKMTTVQERFADIPSNAQTINALLAAGGREVKPATTQITMGAGDSFEDQEAIKQVFKDGQDFGAKAEASLATQDQANQAYILAQEVGPENFGPFSRSTLALRELVSGLGFGDLLEDESKIAPQKALNQLSMSFTMAIVSQTKGAISDREMKLFIAASPTLGSTYEGYLKQLELVSRLAQRDSDFYDAWLDESLRLAEEDTSGVKKQILLEKFATNWKKDNPLFTEQEATELQAMVDSKEGIAEGFVPRDFERAFEARKKDLTKKPQASGQVTKGVAGVPDGSTYAGTDSDGIPLYRGQDGKLYKEDKEEDE